MNAQDLRLQGDLYYMSANLVESESMQLAQKVIDSGYKILLSEEEKKTLYLAYPKHVLYAFGSELYLKSLIIFNGKKYNRTHYYDKLFNLLNEDIKEEIKNEYEIQYNESFIILLEKYANAFESLRYVFEGRNRKGLMKFTRNFCIILNKVVKNHITLNQLEYLY